jgi:hypothetical protein
MMEEGFFELVEKIKLRRFPTKVLPTEIAPFDSAQGAISSP